MYNQTDDDDFFTPSSSSNLATLFNNPAVTSESINQTLMYTAPRQPKNEDKSTKSPPTKPKIASSVISAKPVTLSKLVNEKYTTVGKYGLALIGSDAIKAYELIVYKDTQNVLVRIKVSDKFRFIVQNDNFATFFDDQKQNWLVHFDSIDALNDFTHALKEHGIKIDNRSNTSKQETNSGLDLQEKLMSHNENRPVSILPSVDDTQSDSSGTQARANILSRMAKMGQQILPKQLIKDSVSDLSDSDSDVAKINKKSVRKIKRNHSNDRDVVGLNSDNKDNNKGLKHSVSEDANYKIVSNTSNFGQPYAVAANSNLVPVAKLPSENQIVISQQEVHPTMDHLNLLYNENRVQNNELKLNMSQISLKLEQVLFELQQSKSKPVSSSVDVDFAQSKIKALELQVTNLNQELTKGRECINKCTTYENEIKRMNDIIKEKEAKIEDLTRQSEQEHTQEVDRYKQKIKHCEELINKLEATTENQKAKIESLEELLNENKHNADLQKTIDELTATVSNLKLKLKDFEEYYKVNESNKNEILKQESDRADGFTEKLKLTMNMMFHNVIESFKSDTDDATFQGSFIASVLAQNIKATTYKIIEEFEKDFKVSLNEKFRLGHTENSNQILPEQNSFET